MPLALLIGHTKVGDPVFFKIVFRGEMHYYYYYYFSKKIVNSENKTEGNFIYSTMCYYMSKSPKISWLMIFMA